MDVWSKTVSETGVITFTVGGGSVVYQLGTSCRQVVEIGMEETLPDMLDRIPTLERTVKYLTIGFDTSQRSWDLTNYLYALMASMRSSVVKSVKIDYDSKDVKSYTYFNWSLAEILWPLALREKEVTLVVRGVPSETVRNMGIDRKRALRRSWKPELLGYSKTRTELKRIRGLVEKAGLDAGDHFNFEWLEELHMEGVLVDDEINQVILECATRAETMLSSRGVQDLHQEASTRLQRLRKEIAEWQWPTRLG